MTEHKWLTVAEVEEYKDAGRFDRFTADWLKMREMLVKVHPALYLRLHETWDIRYAISRMLEATADD